ncbi:MAG TPA: hypothetical protein VM840_09310 [Actinomycetota bacterium]|nr:hypothetical protein [Actinomycetota bacterium]
MADVPVTPVVSAPSGGNLWARRYPPLATLVVALLIAFLVLPSALNLPQSNPSTVLEFAPVPPEDDQPPPPQSGSLSSLGLGTTSSLGDLSDQAPPPPIRGGRAGGQGTRALTKRCVGDPPRQTEDPNSPPCVGFFDGDNGGATWQGVTGNEITVVIYQVAYISDQSETEGGDTSAGEYAPSTGTFCDIDRPSNADANQTRGCNDTVSGREMSNITAIRAMSKYFNDRFQTYGRHVHVWVRWSSGSGTPSGRRADAQAIWERWRPFATLDHMHFGGYNDVYAEAIARRGVMVFGSFGQLRNEFYRRNAPYIWSFWPDVEHDVDLYTTYVCSRIKDHRVSKAGDASMNGQPRKYGIMRTTDQQYPGLLRFAELAKQKLAACGISWAAEVTFPDAGYTNDQGGSRTYAGENVATLQQAQVTTVLWLGGMEAKTSAAADRAGYYPEWVIAGDRDIEDLISARAQNQRVFNSAIVATADLREDRFADTPARQAFREVDPNGRQIHEYWATLYYRDYFTLFRGIQVAGPYLSPESVDQGSHAIPRYTSNSPYVAACFYDPGDYSCVKDAQEMYWDSNAADPNGEAARGCWRMVDAGRRYLAGEWPRANSVAGMNNSHPCNGVKGQGRNRTV